MVCQYWISLARPFHRRERLASQLNPAHVLTFFRRRLPAAWCLSPMVAIGFPRSSFGMANKLPSRCLGTRML